MCSALACFAAAAAELPANSGGEVNAAAASTAGTDLAEVVVTAQRRSERAQDVPISVAAFSGQQLEVQQITTSSDLTQVSPGLLIGESNALITPFIRGVGASTNILGEVGSVPFYVDGVYMPLATGAIYDLGNVESVEVLKGPQGTLFGKNALGGALNISTQAPKFTPGGSAEVSYGNLNNAGARAYVTGPITDSIAASFAANYSREDGYINDLIRGETIGGSWRYSARGAVLLKPTDQLSIRVNGDFMETSEPAAVALAPHNGYLGLAPGDPYPIGQRDYIADVRPILTTRQIGGSVRIDYNLAFADLVSLTAYRKYTYFSIISADGTPVRYVDINNTQPGHALSEEVQLLSRGDGPLSWIVGGYYSDEKDQYHPLIINDATRIEANLTSHTYAAYANATYKLGNFELTAGLRVNRDTKEYDASLDGLVLVPNAHHAWTSRTPRAVLAYHPSSDLLAYVSYTSGFKSGAFNYSAFATTPINPELVDAYELGLKYSPTRTLTIDAALYYYNRYDIQVESQSPTTGLQLLENAASGKSKGFDANVRLAPIDPLSLRLGVAYLDGKYSSFPDAAIYVPASPAVPNRLGNAAVSASAAGIPFEHSPKWTGTFEASYKVALPDGGSVVPAVNVYTTSSYLFTASERLKQGGYSLVNAEIAWNLPGDNYKLSVWGKNLGDTTYLRSYFSNSITDAGVYSEPRTYGVAFKARF
jgi:iron complex outermembrane receptor protein